MLNQGNVFSLVSFKHFLRIPCNTTAVKKKQNTKYNKIKTEAATGGTLSKNYSNKSGNNIRKTPVLESLQRLQHRCFPVNFANFLRTSFLQNNSSGVLQ